MRAYLLDNRHLKEFDNLIDEVKVIRYGAFGFDFTDLQYSIMSDLHIRLIDLYKDITENSMEVEE